MIVKLETKKQTAIIQRMIDRAIRVNDIKANNIVEIAEVEDFCKICNADNIFLLQKKPEKGKLFLVKNDIFYCMEFNDETLKIQEEKLKKAFVKTNKR